MSHDPDITTSPETATSPSVSLLGAESAHEFVRYFTASLLALAIDFGVLALLTSVIGVPYLVSAAISFSLGLVLVYILSTRWVFAHRMVKSPAAEFAIFAVIGVIGLGINELILWVLTDFAGFYYLLSKFASVAVVFTWNFVARKVILFSQAQS